MFKRGYSNTQTIFAIALVLVLALSIMLGCVIANTNRTASAETPDWITEEDLYANGYYYRVVDGEAIITYRSQSTFSGNIIIPDQINGYDVVGIGANAFQKTSTSQSRVSYVQISAQVTFIGANAFDGLDDDYCIFLEGDTTGFDANWNSHNVTYITNAIFAVDSTNANNTFKYLVSFENENLFNRENTSTSKVFTCKTQTNYEVSGVCFNADLTGTTYRYLCNVPTGDETVYPVSKPKQQTSGSSSCVAEGTLITLANGTQVPVETLTGSEELLVWDMTKGEYASAPILFIDVDAQSTYEIIELTFSDATVVKVISEHAFFDVYAQEYVFLRADAANYIGHKFNKGDVAVELVAVNVYEDVTTTYSPVTAGALCYYVNGLLSMPGNTEGFINIFEVEDMKVNAEKMAQDIATYGLYTYEEFCSDVVEVPAEVFEAFNGQYLKVSMGKGLISKADVELLFDRYSVFFAEEPAQEVSVFEQIVNAIKSAFESLFNLFK